jgi:hypothetical protein
MKAWSEQTAVQVVAYRMLSRLCLCGLASKLIDQMYLDEDTPLGQRQLVKVKKTKTKYNEIVTGVILN